MFILRFELLVTVSPLAKFSFLCELIVSRI